MDIILPAAGQASRMRGLPKFLLPCDKDYLTLLESHIDKCLQYANNIWIPTRPDLIQLIDALNIKSTKVLVFPFNSRSMNDSISRVLDISSSEFFQVIMPDTFFDSSDPYGELDPNPEVADVAIWKIRPEQVGKLGQLRIDQSHILDIQDKNPLCNYEYSWGALNFSRQLSPFINVLDPHIGYALQAAIHNSKKVSFKKMKGNYYDCGTPTEYIKLLLKLSII